jgi:argininosuccinate lyase
MAMFTKISLTAAVALVAFLAAPSGSLAATKKQGAATKDQDVAIKNQDTDFREAHQKAVSHYRRAHKRHK